TLHDAVRSFLEQSAEELNARVLRKDEAFLFFRRLLNPDPAKACAVKLLHDVHVDYWAVDSQLECYPGHLRFDGYFIKTLTLKHLPSHSFANMFADLSHVKSDMVVATEWRMLDIGASRAQRRADADLEAAAGHPECYQAVQASCRHDQPQPCK